MLLARHGCALLLGTVPRTFSMTICWSCTLAQCSMDVFLEATFLAALACAVYCLCKRQAASAQSDDLNSVTTALELSLAWTAFDGGLLQVWRGGTV